VNLLPLLFPVLHVAVQIERSRFRIHRESPCGTLDGYCGARGRIKWLCDMESGDVGRSDQVKLTGGDCVFIESVGPLGRWRRADCVFFKRFGLAISKKQGASGTVSDAATVEAA